MSAANITSPASPEPPSPTDSAISINPVLVACTLLFIAGISFVLFGANKSQKAFSPALITSHVQTHAQRVAKVTPGAMAGKPEAFEQLQQSRNEINQGLMVLAHGMDYLGSSVAAPTPAQAALLVTIKKTWARSHAASSTILSMKDELIALSKIQNDMAELTDTIEELTLALQKRMVQEGASPNQITQSSHLATLVQSMARAAREISAKGDFGPEQAFLVGKGAATFGETLQVLLNGITPLHFSATKGQPIRDILLKLQATFGIYHQHAKQLLLNVNKLINAKKAEAVIIAESEQLTQSINTLQKSYLTNREQQNWAFWGILTRFF